MDQTLTPLDLIAKGAGCRRPSRIGEGVIGDGAPGPPGIPMSKAKSEPLAAFSRPAATSVASEISVASEASMKIPPTPSVSIRRNSQQAYAEKMHTALVLDWDDTLFPTTWIREELDWRYPLQLQPCLNQGNRLEIIEGFLKKHHVRVAEFLAEAAEQANLFIVTLARRPWVETSMERFMPELSEVLKRHAFKVIYAQEVADEQEVQSVLASGNVQEGAALWTRVKGDAISQELEEFHRRQDASWKNVISLGDSDFERYGTITAGQDYMHREMEGGSLFTTGHTPEGVSKDGHLKRLRLKTVKMLDKPTVLELTAELALLRRWLPFIIQRDSGFDLELDGTDDDSKLVELHRLVTGDEDPSLSWRVLAGMLD